MIFFMLIIDFLNKSSHSVMNASGYEDSILGSVKIRLAELLYKRTGEKCVQKFTLIFKLHL